MPAWSFRSRFHAALANGLAEAAREPPPYPGIQPKRQTIRARRRDGRDPKEGTRVNVWIDQRSPARVFMGETPPIRVARLRIPHVGEVQVDRPARVLVGGSVTRLARADGFATAADFFAFLEADHRLPFDGFLYRW